MSILVTQLAHAQGSGGVILLEPSVVGGGTGPTNVSLYLSSLFDTIILVAAVLAVVMIVVGGIQYMASFASPGQKQEGKDRIKFALGGLLITISAFLVLQTINSNIVSDDTLGLRNLQPVPEAPAPSLEEREQINERLEQLETHKLTIGYCDDHTETKTFDSRQSCEEAREVREGSQFNARADCSAVPADQAAVYMRNVGVCVSESAVERAQDPQTPTSGDETELRTRLRSGGVEVNKPACASVTQTNCTNVAGLPDSAINGVMYLATLVRTDLMITGGTEAGHRTHGVGRPILDLRKGSALDAYIRDNGGTPEPTSYGPRYTIGGATFLEERNPPHWHVVF